MTSMASSTRFKALVEKHGCKVVPVATRINGVLTRRPDIEAVEFHKQFVMTIPRRMYWTRSKYHTDLGGRTLWDYFECEQYFFNKLYASK